MRVFGIKNSITATTIATLAVVQAKLTVDLCYL